MLHPLNYQQLEKYISADNSLERELNLNDSSRTISPELKDALEQTILPNVADPTKNYLYCTLWTMILKDGNTMVGDICIVGEPNERGEIEIGYGTYNEHWGQGYMTEAVGGILRWVATQPEVLWVYASTEPTNTASFRILQKNGFEKLAETDQLISWRIKVK